jgi:outer membrane lipoprotein LolB
MRLCIRQWGHTCRRWACSLSPLRHAPCLALCLLTGMLLAGCQTLPQQPLQNEEPTNGLLRRQHLQARDQFVLQAKLAVQYAGKGYTARMHWQHSAASDVLDIFSPLGQLVAHIERDQSQVSLIDQQGIRHQAQNISRLTEELLGWRLPLAGLSQWVQGIPVADSAYQAVYTPGGEPQQLLQDGWRIDYDSYQSYALPDFGQMVSLPAALRLQQADIRLKLVILDWNPPAN